MHNDKILIMIPNMGWINTRLVESFPYWLKNYNTLLYTPSNLKPLSYARNWCVEKFLEHSDFEWMWLLDDDVSPSLSTLDLLIGAEKQVIAAPVHQMKEDIDGVLKSVPMLMKRGTGESFHSIDGSGIYQIDRAGFACVMFHKSIFGTIPSPWFETRPMGEVRGTDFIFCEKMEEYGIPLYGHFDIRCRQLVEVYI